MYKQAILRLPGRVIRRSRRLAKAVLRRLRPPRRKIVFVFGGRSQYWPGMGRELYEAEPVFRESVRKSAALAKELTGLDLLIHFEGPGGSPLFGDERLVIIGLSIIQIALADLWISKGIRPHAVAGVSLGEVTAGYVAGALTRRETLTICCHSALAYEGVEEKMAVLYVFATLAEAFEAAHHSPVWMEPIYELGSGGCLLFCRADQQAEAVRYLQEQGLTARRPHGERSRPYHTSLMDALEETLVPKYRQANAAPLSCTFYSSAYGEAIPAGSLIDPAYWHQLITVPVRAQAAMQKALGDGYTVFIRIGPDSVLRTQLTELPRGSVSIGSMEQGVREVKQFGEGLRSVRRLRREEPPVPASSWLDHFHFSSPHVARDPYIYFRTLLAKAPVHYLPAEGAWLVLDHELIEEVLQRPEVFSSRLHAPFDLLLLGADPPEHTVMRNLLQPLFSPQGISTIGEATREEGGRLLEGLAAHGSFDLVDQFCLPLTQVVIARFLGLRTEEREELPSVLEGHVYGLAYLSRLETFCHRCLERKEGRTGAIALLLRLVDSGQLKFDEAVRLLRMLWIAGTTTTSMLLSQCIYQLLREPALIGELQKDETLIHKLIEECLRLEAPESELRRITTQPTILGGQSLPEGAIVMLALRAANRDPRVYEQPDRLRLDRRVRKHLSFGGGYHYCLGAGMSRVEVRQAIELLLPVLGGMELHLFEPAVYFPSPHFRGLRQLRTRRRSIHSEPKPKADE